MWPGPHNPCKGHMGSLVGGKGIPVRGPREQGLGEGGTNSEYCGGPANKDRGRPRSKIPNAIRAYCTIRLPTLPQPPRGHPDAQDDTLTASRPHEPTHAAPGRAGRKPRAGRPPPTRAPARRGKTLTQGRHCKLAPTWRARCGLTPGSATLRFGERQVRRASGWATLTFGDPQVGRHEPEGGNPQVRATLRFGV